MLFVNELFYHIIYRVVLLVIIAYSGFFNLSHLRHSCKWWKGGGKNILK